MSTSISLTISAEQEATKTSKSFCDLRKGTCACHSRQLLQPDEAGKLWGRRHTGQGSEAGKQAAEILDFSADKLKRWRHVPARRSDSLSDSKSADEDDEDDAAEDGDHRAGAAAQGAHDFYEEVDERMSRNSCEYPELQASHTNIDRWLRDARFSGGSARARSFDLCHEGLAVDGVTPSGNVIGIRGFSSESFIAESRHQQESYNRLKLAYQKLLANHKRLREQRRGPTRKRERNVEALEELVERQARRLVELNGRQSCDCARRRRSSRREPEREHVSQLAAAKLELKLEQHEAALENLRGENERFKNEKERFKSELELARGELRNLSLEPGNRKYLALCREHARLKDTHDRNVDEFRALQANFSKLEARLESLIEDQKSAGAEQSSESRKLMTELCRLQVYQPKLEMILETERKIKLELASQVERLKRDNDRLSEKVLKLEDELTRARLHRETSESNQLEKYRDELGVLQTRFQRVRDEKSSLEELVRSLRSKASQMDARLRLEIEQAREAWRAELDRAEERISRLESERNQLKDKVERLAGRLAESEAEREAASRELLAAQHQLELAQASAHREMRMAESLKSELERDELRKQLMASESRVREMSAELSLTSDKLELASRELSEQRRRFEQQQRALEELRASKDRELAKLRADLNFEAYNRQVALRGIEKELRSSLKELETVKCRFSSPAKARPSARPSASSNCPNSAEVQSRAADLQSSTTLSSSTMAKCADKRSQAAECPAAEAIARAARLIGGNTSSSSNLSPL